MLTTQSNWHKTVLITAGLTALVTSCAHAAEASPKATANKKRLKVVLLMGQSNMVGYFHPRTAWYLTQPMYVPPHKTATVKDRYYNGGQFYWQGVTFATGSEEFNAKGKALLEERRASRALWRQRAYGNLSRSAEENNWLPEWGPAPKLGTKTMYPFLNKKAEEEGIYKRMVEHIESPENKLHPKVAIQQIAKRDEAIADDIRRVREIFLRGTKPEDFDRLAEALESKGRDYASDRAAYARLLKETVNLPIAERTYISAFGEVAGSPAQGVLSVGYTKWPTSSGPEYPFGISFERLVDGPVLLIKCAVGGTSLKQDWRPPSLATDEAPMGPLLEKSLAHIRSVLADPGKYHPDYDPEEGHEMAGLVWFQGWNDAGNKEYGDQLVTFIKDIRKEMKAPRMPVVCGLLGHVGWRLNTFDGEVNSGMLHAARHPDLRGTVDCVNTVKYMPIELGFEKMVEVAFGKESDEYKAASRIIGRATSKDGTHYHGAAKFAYLTGDAMARSLANLIKGGTPTIHAEAAEILGEQ